MKMSKTAIVLGYIVSMIIIICRIFLPINDFLWGLSIGFLSVIIVVMVFDAYKNRIYNRHFWIFSLIWFSPLAIPMYLIRRDMLIRMGEKFGREICN